MSHILLRDGRATLADPEDVESFGDYIWKIDRWGYVFRSACKKKPYLHRQIMRAPPGQIVDHINGDKLDNRKVNLRFVTSSQNAMNQPSVGVTLLVSGRWQAYISREGEHFYLGVFDTRDEARAARIAGERILFGEYRRKDTA